MTIDPARRAEWLAMRRTIAEVRYDGHAATYDEHWLEVSPVHRRMVEAVVATCPEGGILLDVACGTGKYFGIVSALGRRVVGVDQSLGMLARAKAKAPGVPVAKMRMQEPALSPACVDALMCVDSMELVFPEDWVPVLLGFARALRPGGMCYLTVELPGPSGITESDLATAIERAHAEGIPAVPGEWVPDGDRGGYHHYPSRESVIDWIADAGFWLQEELEADEYWHLLLRAVVS
jgi:SAM-dependent methyltransferase